MFEDSSIGNVVVAMAFAVFVSQRNGPGHVLGEPSPSRPKEAPLVSGALPSAPFSLARLKSSAGLCRLDNSAAFGGLIGSLPRFAAKACIGEQQSLWYKELRIVRAITVSMQSWFAPRTKRFVRGANNDYPTIISQTILSGFSHP